ncbi:MAG: histidine kinase dimerization/phospho-acceptor domain-containing protein, partial [Acidimicrobiales bacterium]
MTPDAPVEGSLLDMVLDAMPTAVLVADTRGRVTRANEAAARLYGRTAGELTGLGVESIFGSGVPVTPWQVLDRSRGRPDNESIYSFDSAVIAPDGRNVAVNVSCSLLRDADLRVFGALYAARDLTETHQLIERLEQAEARWRVIAQLGDLLGRQLDPHESLDETCRWLSRSTNASVALVLTGDGVVERVAAFPTPSAVATRLAAMEGQRLEGDTALVRAVERGEALHSPTLAPDCPLVDETGAPPGIGSAALVPVAGRNIVVGALLVHTEEPGGIRQRALIEQAAERLGLALANSRLRRAVSQFEAGQEAARSREDLMAGVSHDMQTPLAVLLGSLKALADGGDRLSARERNQLYERMARRGLDLRRLVQQFLDYSRLGSGRPIPVRQTMTDIRFTIARVEIDMGGRRPVEID